MIDYRRHASAAVLVFVFATNVLAASYDFLNIADTRGSFEGFDFLAQAVADAGQVAFVGTVGGVQGTYVGAGGAVQQVAQNLAPPTGFQFSGGWSINASGVAVRTVDTGACCPHQTRIQVYDESGTRAIAQEGTAGTVDRTLDNASISNSGAVAYNTRILDFTNMPFIHRGTVSRWMNETSSVLIDTTEGFDLVSGVAISERGDVAFRGKNVAGLSYYRSDGTVLQPLAGPFADGPQFGDSVINDSGEIAFWRQLETGGEGIFVAAGGPLTTVAVADPTTPFYEFASEIDLNNQGTVAFVGRRWDGSYGLYTGDDPVTDKVVEIGDHLFGQRVSGLGRPHLNNRGDIAFWFEVLDPREPFGYWSGIALAVRASSLSGDYNGDGAVDAADYTIWRDHFASTIDLAGNGDETGQSAGIVDQADYTLWKAHFGETTGSGARDGTDPGLVAVPESPAVAILLVGVAIAALARRRPGWPGQHNDQPEYAKPIAKQR